MMTCVTEFEDDRDTRARSGHGELGDTHQPHASATPDDAAEGLDQAENTPPQREKFQIKAWHIILLVVAVLACLGLAYWQWTRFQAGSGTFQNLGYAFQWPLFAVFFIYAYRMGVKYENEARHAKNEADDDDFLYEADLEEFGEAKQEVTKIDEDFLPSRPSLNVEEFNALNTPRRGRDSDTGRPHRADDKHLNT